MLVPGFTVRELPVELNNINNIRYRSDGSMYALGYDGDIWLLRDSDDDGYEDHAHRFFENQGRLRGPIGMAVIPDDHPLLATEAAATAGQQTADRQTLANRRAPRGVIVASKGKVSAILDLDGDDIAEEERIIATGWQEIPQNVDAIGIAIDPDDNAIYFGLGTAAYNNAYLLDESGKSAFDLQSDRGTIQRIDANTLQRTTVCTGVRFSIGMQFDPEKQLFVTDQEGATWLANGNPFDELLHIVPGRHYGFPPRHPRHLPNVFDEPSTFDYAPQHQSTCGMVFDLPFRMGGPIFGPASWRGDLIVTGESRGKLYRTQLSRRTDGEYVAKNVLIGCLPMLTVDCCISPRGELIVACHSGGPDWGTGPTGKGSLFAVRYDLATAESRVPLPLATYCTGANEVRIEFDAPLDPTRLQQLTDRLTICYGTYVAAGDRFETIRPGYAVTEMQQSMPTKNLQVISTALSADRRTLIIATAAHNQVAQYALTIDGLAATTEPSPGPPVLPQHTALDLAYSLNGVEAEWTSLDGSTSGRFTLDTADLDVAIEFAENTTWRTELLRQLATPGELRLSTQLDLRGIFAPHIQPGKTLDYRPADDTFITERALVFAADHPFTVAMAGSPAVASKQQPGGTHQVHISVTVEQLSSPTPLSIRLATDHSLPHFNASWQAVLSSNATRIGPLPLRQWLLPWAPDSDTAESPSIAREPIELANASWGRGRQLFFDGRVGCSKCHSLEAIGQAMIGPDLANLKHRDYRSVLRDIQQPSFAINPDYIPYAIHLHDGRVINGVVRNEGDELLVGDRDGKITRVPTSQVDALKPTSVSVMPDKLLESLSDSQVNDLLAYLLRRPPSMPLESDQAAPPARSRKEVLAVLDGSTDDERDERADPSPLRPLRLLLVDGTKDHGPGEHDYPAWLAQWSELLAGAESVQIETAHEWPERLQIERADAIVFYQRGSWNADRAQAIDDHLARGRGLAYIHWAVEAGEQAPEFAQRIGLASNATQTRYRHGPLDLGFLPNVKHPIQRNLDKVSFYDESYWALVGNAKQLTVLAEAREEDANRPQFWTMQPGKGRVFVSIPGHYSWTFDDPIYRIILLRGIAWTVSEPVDRFNELVWPGARVE
ncbi:MAG: ThuA domain-containing protein [Pirellulaceae bacterium]